jgi:peptidoglycan pentaglycine glycine transferase (the first glycine)
MQLRLDSNPQKEIFNAFIAANGGSFLQSFEWGEWQSSLGRRATQYAVVNAAGHIVLAAQLLRYNLPLGQQYLYCPYGPVVAKGLDTTDAKSAFVTLLTTVQAQHSQALFVKLESLLTPPELADTQFSIAPGTRIQPGATLVLDLSPAEEELMEQMHKKTRYDIRIALKHGVRIQAVSDLSSIDATEALKLIAHTEQRQNYIGHNLAYYQKLIAQFATVDTHGPRLSIQVARHSDQVLASGIFIDFAGTRTYLFGGSSLAHREVMPAYALHWHLIQDAKKQGIQKYDFWGIETSSGTTPGFVRFKLGFGGHPIQYPPPVDITWKPFAYQCYKLAKKILR